ncbi:hypothetical protein FOZ60_016105 [Perkinsus olseni]|uniref:Uncharacterized protein n=1 Tax=Perkinsus olseni TaxID=32597 RepID=A0A7J6N4E0_PEROL|nr:hypothetical protein FOZ60_016105 [Perkinsus olseni]
MRYGPQSPGKSEPQHIDDVLQPTRHSAPQGCPEVDDASPAVSVVRQRFKRLRIDGEDDEPELSESSGLISGDETQLEGVPEHKRRCTDVSSDKSSIGSSCGDRSDQGPSSPRQSDTPMVASRNDQLHHQRKMQLKQLLKEQMAKYLADYRSLSQRTQIEEVVPEVEFSNADRLGLRSQEFPFVQEGHGNEIPQRLSFTEPIASLERCRPVELEERNSQPVESTIEGLREQPSRRTASSEVERSIAELSLKCQQLTGQLERLAKNFAREVDERRGTEDKLTRHVQQQVEELVNIVRESEAKTEQDVGQALKVLRSNLSLQMTEASGRHLQKLEKKLSDEFNKGRSTERFTDALDPMRATLTDLSSRFEEVESKAMPRSTGRGTDVAQPAQTADHRERSPPRECDVEMKLKLQQIERKLAAKNPDVRLASMRSETQDSLNAVNQRIDTLQGELESFRGSTSDAMNSQTQRLKDHVLGEVKKNAAEAQRREQELSRTLEASINSVSDSHDELKKSLETDFRSAVDNKSPRRTARELSDKVGRIQRELNGLYNAERRASIKTVAEFKEKVNVMSANSSKFITEQITELEKRTTESLAESRSSIMRGFESDLMRITEELDCHVKSVQSSTEERMKGPNRNCQGRGWWMKLVQRSMDADRLEHREMISQLYKKMSDVVSAMHYPKYGSCRRSSMVVAAAKYSPVHESSVSNCSGTALRCRLCGQSEILALLTPVR